MGVGRRLGPGRSPGTPVGPAGTPEPLHTGGALAGLGAHSPGGRHFQVCTHLASLSTYSQRLVGLKTGKRLSL